MTSDFDRLGEWALDPAVDFLNHGSFGACPPAVLEAEHAFQRRFERRPIEFVLKELEPALDAVRTRVAGLLGCRSEDLVFVTNPTTGVGAVLAATPLHPGDEVLVTSHGYNACRNAALFWTSRAGARVVTAELPFPIADEGAVIEAVLAKVGPKTRLAIIDHVTSPTALVLPIEELARELKQRGVAVLIDGAHGPGMLELSIGSLGGDYYVGTLHKWCCAPKGVSFLYADAARQAGLHPLVISHGYTSERTDRPKLHLEFDWVGTYDPSGILAAPIALDYLESLLPGGLPALMERNRALAVAARAMLARRLGLEPPCPESMLGSMAALALPDGSPGLHSGSPFAEPISSNLRDRHRIEVPVMRFPRAESRLLRISAQAYNHLGQYERLAEVLELELASR